MVAFGSSASSTHGHGPRRGPRAATSNMSAHAFGREVPERRMDIREPPGRDCGPCFDQLAALGVIPGLVDTIDRDDLAMPLYRMTKAPDEIARLFCSTVG